ncbi:MAG TPA: CpsD/CapB family tyrosine-protein kinase [Silvibacterium sp.]|nr:CpsD/CapB family tyrosine-protein kinase [Silvibacterium sp.]
MSRVFDALQRSGAEQSGVEYPDMMSMVTQLFEPRAPEASELAPADQAAASPAPSVGAETTDAKVTPIEKFPSLKVRVHAASRLVVFTEPDSLAAEKFRFLGVRLRQLQQSRPLKKVLVTSTIPEEGKSLISANLAGVFARRQQKVLLIEGDLRRPVLARQFGLGHLAGLGEWLQGGAQAISNIYHLEGPNFWLMPAGDPPTNPLELMQSGRLSQLIAQLSDLFDWIVVDSPPLLPLADTTVWARLTDGALLVAREGKTEKGALQRGLEILKKSDLLGVVLNGCASSDYKNYYQRYSSSEPK